MLEQKSELDLIKEQRTARRRKYFREYRKARRQQETPEEKAVRCGKNNELYKRRCSKKKNGAMERAREVLAEKQSLTEEQQKPGVQGHQNEKMYKACVKPEQSEVRRLNDEDLQKNRERHRQNRKLRESRMTEEQKEARRIKTKEQNRLRQDRLNREMPEKAAAIRSRISEMRKRRRMLEEKTEKKRKSEYMRDYRKRIRMMETPQEKEARQAKDRETIKIRRRNRRLLKQSILEIKEQRIKQKEQDRSKQIKLLSQYRDRILKSFTPKQTEDRFKTVGERTPLICQKQREMKDQSAELYAAGISSPPRRQFKASWQQQSQSTYDIKIENEVIQETRLERISKLNKQSQHEESWPLFERSEASLITDEYAKSDSILMENCYSTTNNSYVEDAFDCMRAVIDLKATQDGYWIYGQHLANQIRNSGKSEKEIYIAKQLIDNVIQNFYLDDRPSEEHTKMSTTQHWKYINVKSETLDQFLN